jgi:phosphoribosylformimino-5-aminoimidazole carboxamide ribonucleotide (ProFAR) isomerase/phosphoribosyl-ATP pyrophosphohydrolase
METKMRTPIIINGNDGTGKSTLVNYFNSIPNNNFYMIERSTPNLMCPNIESEQIKWADNETLLNTWERTSLSNKLSDNVYRFILDLEPETINKRISNRDTAATAWDAWDTPKSIKYFKQRFTEISYYYGVPLLNYENKTPEEISNEIIQCIQSGLYDLIKYMRLENIDREFIKNHSIEDYLINNFDRFFTPHIETIKSYVEYDFKKNGLFRLEDYPSCLKNIIVVWFLSNSKHHYTNNRNTYLLSVYDIHIEIELNKPYFIKYIEGESKAIFKILSKFDYWDDLVLITLKPTIYSHSKQATGEIKDLEKIRAQGTMLFMEMLYRNDILHSYRSINSNGIIISKFANTNQLELVFKRYCEGTDKHSYYGIRNNNSIILDNGEYVNSLYIRFDWRNPNHVLGGTTGINVNTDPYYYFIETYEGKETFFTKYLSKNNHLEIKPFGDKTVNIDILNKYANVNNIKKSVIKIYSTIESYLNKIGIEAKDGCFMIDCEGKYFWSEINQDCMRLKTVDSNVSYDKDIWRVGGSSQSGSIVDKWCELNSMMMKYFENNRFHKSEMLYPYNYEFTNTLERFLTSSRYSISNEYKCMYKSLINQYNTHGQRRVLLTLDIYNNKPVLVQRGKVFENHSETITEALDKIALYPDVLLVDLNGAIDKNKQMNRHLIKEIATKQYIHTGGGVHTLEDAQDLLQSSVRRVVISSNTTSSFISQIPKSRLIVELSVNDMFEVLIDGRKTNTHIHFREKIVELANQGVEAVSVTFQETEGMRRGIPREMIRELSQYIPKNVSKVFIAGGITTIDELKFIWSFPKFIPQLGSAIWKNDIELGDLYSSMAKWDENDLMSCIIQNKNGLVLGLVHMNRQALQMTCKTKLLYIYSKEHNEVTCDSYAKNNQRVMQMSFNCNNESLLIVVNDENPFCHTNNKSCYSNQTVIKANMNIINEHIANCDESTSKYVSKLKKFPGFNLLKINEEFWEMLSNPNVHECSDFLIHFIIYLNSIGINWDDICNELNARRWNPKIVTMRQEKKNLETDKNNLFLGITGTKYQDKTYMFLLNELGIQMSKLEGRSLEIKYDIIDEDKYNKYFKNKKLYFVNMKPKDMPYMVSSATIDGAITYSSVIVNQPDIFDPICEVIDNEIELALIKRKSDNIDASMWSEHSKCYIACEHVVNVYKYLTKDLGINESVFSTVHMLGSSESFLVNKSKTHYNLADAIVESGSTLEANNLEIWKTIIPKGEVKIGLYLSKMTK